MICELFAFIKQARFFPYKHGAPSHDTLGRVLANLNVSEFDKCIISWSNSLSDLCRARAIALDGKTICGAASIAALGFKLHIVSAFCNKNKISIGQLTVNKRVMKSQLHTQNILNA